jgi:uncharacterized membrane protein YkvA (DUF1232 family)
MKTSKPSKKPLNAPVHKAKPTNREIAHVVEKTKSRAEIYARDPMKAKKLLDDVVKKIKSYEGNRGPLAEVWSYLQAIFRLLRAYIRKDYRDIAWGAIVLVIVAIIYVGSAIDLIPDILPGGIVDDAAVIAFVVAQTKADLDKFLAWEVERSEGEIDSEEVMSEPA